MTYNKGFSLIELLTVISIMGVITVISISSYRSSNAALQLKNDRSTLEMAIRKVQQYGSSGKKTDLTGASDPFNVPYGIHFEKSPPAIKLYADLNVNGTIDTVEYLETVSLQNVSDVYFCAHSTDDQNCDIGISENNADISFRRPQLGKLNARILSSGSSGDQYNLVIMLKSIDPSVTSFSSLIFTQNGSLTEK